MMRDPSRLNEKVFIYFDSVRGTGGALSIAYTLQLWGFHWIKSVPKS